MSNDTERLVATTDNDEIITETNLSRDTFLDTCDVCGKHWTNPKERTVEMHKLVKHSVPKPKSPGEVGKKSSFSNKRPSIEMEKTQARFSPVEQYEVDKTVRDTDILRAKNEYYQEKKLNDSLTAGEREEQQYRQERQENTLLDILAPIIQNAIRPADNSIIEMQLADEKRERQKLENEIRERDREERQQMMDELRQLRRDVQDNTRQYADFKHEVLSTSLSMFKEGYQAKLSKNNPSLAKQIEAKGILDNTPPIEENPVKRKETNGFSEEEYDAMDTLGLVSHDDDEQLKKKESLEISL